MRRLFILISSFCFLTGVYAATAPASIKAAILPLGEDYQLFDDAIYQEIQASGKFSLLEQAKVNAAMLESIEVSDALQIGRTLGVQVVIYKKITKIDGEYLINIRGINVQSEKVIFTEYDAFTMSNFSQRMKNLVSRIASKEMPVIEFSLPPFKKRENYLAREGQKYTAAEIALIDKFDMKFWNDGNKEWNIADKEKTYSIYKSYMIKMMIFYSVAGAFTFVLTPIFLSIGGWNCAQYYLGLWNYNETPTDVMGGVGLTIGILSLIGGICTATVGTLNFLNAQKVGSIYYKTTGEKMRLWERVKVDGNYDTQKEELSLSMAVRF